MYKRLLLTAMAATGLTLTIGSLKADQYLCYSYEKNSTDAKDLKDITASTGLINATSAANAAQACALKAKANIQKAPKNVRSINAKYSKDKNLKNLPAQLEEAKKDAQTAIAAVK